MRPVRSRPAAMKRFISSMNSGPSVKAISPAITLLSRIGRIFYIHIGFHRHAGFGIVRSMGAGRQPNALPPEAAPWAHKVWRP